MAEESHSERPSLLRRILSVPAEIVVGIFVILDGIISPLFRPLMRFLSSLRLVRRLEAVIAALPPYVILVLLVVPFGFAELAKVYAVVLMAEDHFRTGLTLFIGAYIVSILVCERTFHAGKGQLMKIGWFKTAFDWIMGVKAYVLGWLSQTRVWRVTVDVRRRISVSLRQMKLRLQSIFGPRPKRSLQRR